MTDVFDAERSRLIAVAYGMLGSMADAEDIVQDAWIRWQNVDQHSVRAPAAYLTTMVTRMSIDRLRSARHRRESYVGPWLPEPVVAHSNDPADIVAEAEHFSMAFLHALENLTPVERAVLLLREAFDYDYTEIADIVDKSPDNCRQIATRARGRVAEPPQRRNGDPEREHRVVAAALRAVRAADVDGLISVLADDIVAWSDGGPKRRAARHPVVGAARVARFLIGVARQSLGPELRVTPVTIGGDPGVRLASADELYGVLTFRVEEDRSRASAASSTPTSSAGPADASCPSTPGAERHVATSRCDTSVGATNATGDVRRSRFHVVDAVLRGPRGRTARGHRRVDSAGPGPRSLPLRLGS
ncbi:MAG: RNA polymerase sigma factor SigJ [Acidimicrobiia bacterium]|nr:RNA polymerase sigma factor SigJ [Acidimicrobiia bacterium]